ncbi:MAG TPA: hypothetical protein VJ256_05215 [Dehalococcoidia bacterium]|nr:hypothetical protein [Dehalococcoidia bacterium]HLB29498.1 hypothetical protein [Dehalococcoidia bacterium]
MERRGYMVYQGYLDGHEQEIERGEPFIVEVRDMGTLSRMGG